VGRIPVPVRRATARLVIAHTLVNDELKYDPILFFFGMQRASARLGMEQWRHL